jgi:hypothetical protein
MASEILADRSLACRLERAEGLTNGAFVEARARLMPDSGAKWISVAGACAMFDGVESPWTQTFGLGLFQMPTVAELTVIEDFFKERGARVFHEVSPLADKAILAMLGERGYRPFEMSNVMFLPLSECRREGKALHPWACMLLARKKREFGRALRQKVGVSTRNSCT